MYLGVRPTLDRFFGVLPMLKKRWRPEAYQVGTRSQDSWSQCGSFVIRRASQHDDDAFSADYPL